MPIRWRLTLWFSLVLCLTIIVSGVVIHTLLQRSLYNDLDDHLRIQSARVHGTLDPQVIPEPLDYDVIHSSLPQVDEFASPGVWFQLIDADGKVVVKSDNLGERELPTDAILLEQGLAGEVAMETISASDNARVRVMVSPLFFETETLLLLVGESVGPINATMGQVTWAILHVLA